MSASTCSSTNTGSRLTATSGPAPKHWALVLIAIGSVIAGCAREQGPASPLASVAVAVSPTEAAVGSPLDMTYTFVVASGAPPVPDDLVVFVHFLDSDGERMWTDDHQPPAPASDWKPGATIRYTRTAFVPRYPYVGEASIVVGLYSPKTGERFVLSGAADAGLRAYRTSTFNLRLKLDGPFVTYADGWFDVEGTPDAGGSEWRWSKKAGTLSFRNPKRDVVLLLDADQPVPLPQSQQVKVQIGAAVVDAFPLTGNQRELRRVSIPASQLGDGDTVEVNIGVDRTFVPRAIPSLGSADPRELGIRVFHAYVR